jgi:hypothetical protein
LALNPEKTRLARMADGFRYLGYLFLNDMAVDVSGQRPAEASTEPPSVPPLSWLARAGRQKPKALDFRQMPGVQGSNCTGEPSRASPALRSDAVADPASAQFTAAEAETHGSLLCVTGSSTVLSTQAGHLRVSRGEDLLHEVPWQQLQAVLLFGQHHLTEPALRAALESETPDHLASAGGGYRGVIWNGQPRTPEHGLWLRQASLFIDPPCALALARAVVDSRLRHQREVLRRRGVACKSLDDCLAKLPQASDLAVLNGLEGRRRGAISGLWPTSCRSSSASTGATAGRRKTRSTPSCR